MATQLRRFRSTFKRLDEARAGEHEWRRLHYEMLAAFVDGQRSFMGCQSKNLAVMRHADAPPVADRARVLALFEELGQLHDLLRIVDRRVRAVSALAMVQARG